MSYFDTSIHNDISYLFTEIGRDILINNIPAKAIINNPSMERTYDDKQIITHEELKRGQYIKYNDLYFLLLNEVNDKRYLAYWKGIMRRCNFDIKFIIDGKLYLFYTIVESDKFGIDEGQYFPTLANTITLTLPLTDITKQITEGDRFIKFGKAFEVKGIDYTQDGLIHLHSEVDIKGADDDIENEIADKDKLDNEDDIVPILPFDEMEEAPEEPEEPLEPLEIIGDDWINTFKNGIYETIVNLDVEDKSVTYTLSSTLATIKNQDGISCELVANKKYQYGYVDLIATLNANESVSVTKTVNVRGI